MKEENLVLKKSKAFAIRTIHLYQYLMDEKKEFIMSKQVLRSRTSIGANICEAEQAQSPSDFISKLSISLKEACESDYWLRLLHRTGYLNDSEYAYIIQDCRELTRLLTSIIKSLKNKQD